MQAALEEAGCPQLLAIGADHVTHLSGYTRYLAGHAAVIVKGDGHTSLIVPSAELEVARAESAVDEVFGYGAPDLLALDPLRTMLELAVTLLGPGSVALAGSTDARRCLPEKLRDPVAFDDALENVQLVKDPDEIDRIERSYRICLNAQAAVADTLVQGTTEIGAFNVAQNVAQLAAGGPVEFICTVAAGSRAALIGPPFVVPAAVVASQGDPVLVDIAVRAEGYWGDSARTDVVGDNAEVMSAVASLGAIKDSAARLLKPGARAADIFEFVRDELSRAFPGNVLRHHAGHGIGIAVGEAPQLLPESDRMLEANMVIALEPSVYVEGRWGARHEDLYLVTDDGGRLLTSADANDS